MTRADTIFFAVMGGLAALTLYLGHARESPPQQQTLVQIELPTDADLHDAYQACHRFGMTLSLVRAGNQIVPSCRPVTEDA